MADRPGTVASPRSEKPTVAGSNGANGSADDAGRPSPTGALLLAVVGVVYGDIGTSPLYAVRECFRGSMAVPLTAANVLGILSLILWSLVLVVSVKYMVLVLRADNEGEGGILALMALAVRSDAVRRRWWIILLGLFGAGLLYGDGMITPAISVLSAVEGLGIATPTLQPYVLPLTLAILLALFAMQHRGTAKVGGLFGPVMLAWFACLALLGATAIVRQPVVLRAISPHYALTFFWHNQWPGFVVLGIVFLVVTGGEALYADLGHFGARPIRIAWFGLVLPTLLINYFGQGALLIAAPRTAENPFYYLAPDWARFPLVVLATLATVIASQAIISGAFSLARQAVSFGYLPRLRIVHTSSQQVGQIYAPAVNWALFVAVIVLVLTFGSSTDLASAYGMAVNMTMVITALLLYVVVRGIWHWPKVPSMAVVGFFLVVDLLFLVANWAKFLAGGWLPLLVAGGVCLLMLTWKRGRRVLAAEFRAQTVSMADLLEELRRNPPERVPGMAVYLTGDPEAVPLALSHNLKHNKVLHQTVGILTILSENEPRVPPQRRLEIRPLEHGLYRLVAHYGFMEQADVPKLLQRARQRGIDLKPEDTTFFLGRETLVIGKRPTMAGWRKRLFAWMSHNAHDASGHFGIPPDKVVEVGVRLEM